MINFKKHRFKRCYQGHNQEHQYSACLDCGETCTDVCWRISHAEQTQMKGLIS